MGAENFGKKRSDDELLHLIKDGNELAFAQLFESYWEELLDTAYRVLQDKDAAKDIVQEVFTNLWRHRQGLSVKNITSYLHQSTRYAVFRFIKKSKTMVTDFDLVSHPIEVNNTEETIRYHELSDQLENLVGELPEQCQKVFRLSRFEHLSNKEIATKLDISVRTVENHMAKALTTLRFKLNTLASITAAIFMF